MLVGLKFNITRLSLFVYLLLIGSYSNAQLPSEWLGHYVGELNAVNIQGQSMTFHMELDISERQDSTYNFTIIYGEDTLRQERAYILVPKSEYHYLLDEQNGILLDMNLGHGRLVSVFMVQENLLHVSYIKTKKGIRFELTSSATAATTGGTTTDAGEDIPSVTSYNTTTFQYADLKKQK